MCRLGDEGASLFSRAPWLGQLAHLDVAANSLFFPGLRALLDALSPKHLRSLEVDANPIGDFGARAIATAPNLKNLERLVMEQTSLTSEGARGLFAPSSVLGRLNEIDLRENIIDAATAQALVTSALFKDAEVIFDRDLL